MQDKIKFVLIGLAAVIVIMLFLLLQSGQYAGKLKAERDDLKEAGNVLTGQLASLNKENRQIKEEFNNTKKTLENLQAEKTQVENKFNSLVGERDRLKDEIEQLNTKLTSLQAKASKSEEDKKESEGPASPTADAYWAGILKKKAELELKLENLRGELKAAKLDNEQLRRDKESLSLDMQSYETDRKDTTREYEYNKKLSDNLTVELTREKTDKFQLAETVKALKNENKFLKSQLKTIFDRKTKLEDKYAELQDRNSVLENNMAKLESFVREKILQVDSLKNDLGIVSPAEGQGKKNSIELAPIVIRPQEDISSKAAPVRRTVSVIAVNRDNNFVILSTGNDAGIKVGDTFRIFRQDESIGTVEVIQVRDNISACDIKNEFKPIVVGDFAK